MATPQTPIVAFRGFRSTDVRHLGQFIELLHNHQPQEAATIRTIILSSHLDSIDNSAVLELLYHHNWDQPYGVQATTNADDEAETGDEEGAEDVGAEISDDGSSIGECEEHSETDKVSSDDKNRISSTF